MTENKGNWYEPNELSEELKRIKKAKEHEMSFGNKQNPDIIKKRMDSDLFKGGMR